MQIMYVMTFLMTLVVLMVAQGKDSADLAMTNATSVAGQMVAWHGVATRHCAVNACAGGIVDVRPHLNPMLRNGPAFSSGRFVTRFDNVNGVVVTYMADGYVSRGTVTFGGVSAALRDQVPRGEESSSIGVWRRADGAVALSFPPRTTARTIPLATPFMGGTIPDGSPIIVNRI